MNYLNLIYFRSLVKCEQLKSMDVISDYDIELRKENERLCLDDMVTEFDAVMDIKLSPKKSVQYIQHSFTIMKNSGMTY